MYILKKKVLFVVFIFFFSTLSLKAQNKLNKSNKRPNIIVLLTGDQRWNILGAMGNSIIQTPHLDKLATAGILFQNAYVTNCLSVNVI